MPKPSLKSAHVINRDDHYSFSFYFDDKRGFGIDIRKGDSKEGIAANLRHLAYLMEQDDFKLEGDNHE